MKQQSTEPHWLDDLSEADINGLSEQLISGFAGNSYEVVTPKTQKPVTRIRKATPAHKGTIGFLTAA
ncbi:hypothetical protein SAMN04489743_2819 [Pseudarthrobacter equi]|uniref:Uncharacterized protein n=2 Tax=Pseudarthrobacter equi TaxID=728066 RepID=A0A1H2A6Q6_9MICC|nr:hypothetical protein SAMN04489743_2819 [Pseudarthrobacter equi]